MKKENWIIKIFLITFVLASIFGLITTMLSELNVILLILILAFVIFVGIIFDMIGVAILSCDEVGFHAKASKKIDGAKESIKLIRDSVKVSSICNDVIGDICGILSGALGASLVFIINKKTNISYTLISIVVGSIISTLTVGGKAIGKKIAVKNCEKIVFKVGKIKKKIKL